MKRKKKGSSLLLVVAIFGILTVIGLSMLGVVTSGYKLRVEENNKIKNLYSAESGLDEAYTRMCKVVNAAIAEGVKAGDKVLGDNIKEKNDKFQEVYKTYLRYNLVAKVEEEYDIDGKSPSVEAELDDTKEQFSIQSTYTDENNKTRTVKVNYTIKTPDGYKNRTTTNGELSPIINYSMATDKNIVIANGGGKLDVDGQVWVKGDSDKTGSNIDPVTGKYKGGISIENGEITFNSLVNTASNITVDNNGSVIFKGDAYSENILLGNVYKMDENRGAVLKAEKDLNLANDLVVACNDAKCDILNLYAFNDINNSSYNKIRSSSSIIVNSMKWPEAGGNNGYINVTNSAYILGAAYIKTEEAYQTGESVSYKGNYKAYSTPLNGTEQFTYINPLMLVTSNNGEKMDLSDKAAYFVDYSRAFQLRTEGISLPENNTFSVGAYISDGNVVEGKATMSLPEKKTAFAREVYNMGVSTGVDDNTFEKNFLRGNILKTVSSEINWDGVSSVLQEKADSATNSITIGGKDKEVVIVLNNDDSKEINITNSEIRVNGKEAVKYDSKKQYMVISTGKVNCKNSADFNGIIIALEDISVGDNTKHIGTIFDEEILKDESNRDILNLIFGAGDDSFEETIFISAEDIISEGKWTLVK